MFMGVVLGAGEGELVFAVAADVPTKGSVEVIVGWLGD